MGPPCATGGSPDKHVGLIGGPEGCSMLHAPASRVTCVVRQRPAELPSAPEEAPLSPPVLASDRFPVSPLPVASPPASFGEDPPGWAADDPPQAKIPTSNKGAAALIKRVDKVASWIGVKTAAQTKASYASRTTSLPRSSV